MARIGLAVVLIAAVTPMLQADARPCVDRLPWTQVKAADPTHRALLRQGIERSTTFRHLIADLEASAWLVFVQTGRCPDKLTVACLLHFVGRFEGQPYLRVIARHEPRHPDNVISILAHELQHAREVVQAVGVADAGGLRDLFKRIGRISVERPGVVTYETERAVLIEETVWRELARAPRYATFDHRCVAQKPTR